MSSIAPFSPEFFSAMKPGKVVDLDPLNDRVFQMDLTDTNTSLQNVILTDTEAFGRWVNRQLADHQSNYGIGGYNEHRTIYSRSPHFGTPGDEEPRRLHLGTDIWGRAGTPVYNFADAIVHGFANNNNFGDYGHTIVLRYVFAETEFFALYGHLSAGSIENLSTGRLIRRGEKFAEFGQPDENGYWPPHLHFQLIKDMQGGISDYPGVCKFSERDKFLANCPDPVHILSGTFNDQYS